MKCFDRNQAAAHCPQATGHLIDEDLIRWPRKEHKNAI